MEKYQRLKTRMSYKDARRIMGCNGQEITQNQFGSVQTTMYQWDGGLFGGSMQLIFQNDSLTSKAQSGLD
jgi:hypothetical protein